MRTIVLSGNALEQLRPLPSHDLPRHRPVLAVGDAPVQQERSVLRLDLARQRQVDRPPDLRLGCGNSASANMYRNFSCGVSAVRNRCRNSS